MIALSDFLSSSTLSTLRSIYAEELAQVDAADLLVKVTELEVSIHHLPATLPADCFTIHVCHFCCRIVASWVSESEPIVDVEGRKDEIS